MELLLKYFPELDEKQKEQFAALGELYTDWNAKINVISRKDIGNLYEHHVLHSLGIAKVIHSVLKPKSWIWELAEDFPASPWLSFPGSQIPSGRQHRQESTCGF